MFVFEREKSRDEKFRTSIKRINRSWKEIKKDISVIREEIAQEYFNMHPSRRQLFENVQTSLALVAETDVDRKVFKHSTAVVNFMEAIVDFVNGNEESKPMYFVLGRHHRRLSVNEKMFLEMKEAICRVLKRRFASSEADSWETVLEYIMVNYVFRGMQMVETF